MRIPRGRREAPLGFNTTPMIDVVFQLIIFFLVSSHLAQQETQAALELPAARSGHLPGRSEPRRIVVSLAPNGALALSGQAIGTTELASRLRVEGQAHVDCEVRIRADRNVPYRLVEPVLAACAEAGLCRVTFAVVERTAHEIP